MDRMRSGPVGHDCGRGNPPLPACNAGVFVGLPRGVTEMTQRQVVGQVRGKVARPERFELPTLRFVV
jgi:hypothetical protein